MFAEYLDFLPLLAWQNNDAAEAAGGAIALIFSMLIFLVEIVLALAMLALGIMNLYFNYQALEKLPPQFRQMEPYQVFFLLIPCFNMVWNFFVFTKVPASLQAYFYQKGRTDVGDCGAQLGLWLAISALVCPCAVLVLLPMYVLKIRELQAQL